MIPLTPADVADRLATLPGWSLVGNQIERVFEFSDFASAMAFVNRLAGRAEEHQHHPDIDIRWNRVRLAYITHDCGGLTALDFQEARVATQLAYPGSPPI